VWFKNAGLSRGAPGRGLFREDWNEVLGATNCHAFVICQAVAKMGIGRQGRELSPAGPRGFKGLSNRIAASFQAHFGGPGRTPPSKHGIPESPGRFGVGGRGRGGSGGGGGGGSQRMCERKRINVKMPLAPGLTSPPEIHGGRARGRRAPQRSILGAAFRKHAWGRQGGTRPGSAFSGFTRGGILNGAVSMLNRRLRWAR